MIRWPLGAEATAEMLKGFETVTFGNGEQIATPPELGALHDVEPPAWKVTDLSRFVPPLSRARNRIVCVPVPTFWLPINPRLFEVS